MSLLSLAPKITMENSQFLSKAEFCRKDARAR